MAIRKVAVIGSGAVGEALSNGFLKHGYEVLRASRNPSGLEAWHAKAGGAAAIGTLKEAAAFGEVIVLAVKGTGAESAVRLIGPEALAGRIVLDATNPISDEPPDNGILRYFTDINMSLMERLQNLAPTARFVKVFSCVGSGNMVNPDFGGERPTMFICGNDAGAKAEVTTILDRFGWDAEDIGGVEGARAIEPLAILWCAPGFLRGQWTHAYRVLRR
jgi:hypothetical protein